MRHIITFLSSALIFLTILLGGCNTENDFYEVGRQPVQLVYPLNDTIWDLNYQKPDSLYRFAWTCKRNYIDYDLQFSLQSDMSQPVSIPTGIRRDFYLTTMQIDSILSSFNVGIGESTILYWNIKVVKEDDGWCDEVRKLNISRCDLPTNVILLESPDSQHEIQLDKATPEAEILFTWNCQTEVKDYTLYISLNEAFENAIEVDCGNSKSQAFTHQYFDELLRENNIYFGKSKEIYWKVTGTGNLNNPIENSAVRTTTFVRYQRDPMPVNLKAPANNATILLSLEAADEEVKFEWKCDTTGVNYKLHLFDTELGVSHDINCGEKQSFSITQFELDQLLEQKFEMVAAQKKKIYWKVIADNPLRAVSEETNLINVRRFVPLAVAPPIVLVNGPADNTSYTLVYAQAASNLFTASWNCAASKVTYAIECSLLPDMKQSVILPLSTDKNFSFTHGFADDMLIALGASYQTKKIYWRITSTVNIQTAPSDIRSMTLTGMMRPFVDKRDASKPETYRVVKVGNAIWMAENLRATKYADGAAFTTVDCASKTYAEGINPQVVGQYYTWPTAVRHMNQCSDSKTTQVQGVCPNGWHVSNMNDWENVISALSVDPNPDSPVLKAKDPQYWSTKTDITNSSGLSFVPGGKYWHNNLTYPDNVNDKASYWTTTTSGAVNAYMYEIFDWDYSNMVPWTFQSRPWSEGDGTASMLVNVRCVRNY